MATTRKRLARGLNIPRDVMNVLGHGMGMNLRDDEWLKEQWRIYGAALSRHWQSKFNKKPFGAVVAEVEKWQPSQAQKLLTDDLMPPHDKNL